MTVTKTELNLRSGSGTSNPILTTMPSGASVIVGKKNADGWHRVFYNGIAGWCSGAYLSSVQELPFIDASFIHLGKWYWYGASGPDRFDCSGLTWYVLKARGFPNVGPRSSANTQMHKFRSGAWKGKKVTIAEAQPGDMAFFGYNTTVNGKPDQHASHVVFMLSPEWCLGANGGSATTKTDAQAKARNAKVRIDKRNYRETASWPHRNDLIEIWRPLYS